jgi:hypothetical protein
MQEHGKRMLLGMKSWGGDTFHLLRYKERDAETQEKNVTHLERAETTVLEEHKEVVMVWKSSRKIRMR